MKASGEKVKLIFKLIEAELFDKQYGNKFYLFFIHFYLNSYKQVHDKVCVNSPYNAVSEKPKINKRNRTNKTLYKCMTFVISKSFK